MEVIVYGRNSVIAGRSWCGGLLCCEKKKKQTSHPEKIATAILFRIELVGCEENKSSNLIYPIPNRS